MLSRLTPSLQFGALRDSEQERGCPDQPVRAYLKVIAVTRKSYSAHQWSKSDG
jgi:hypothetical protein